MISEVISILDHVTVLPFSLRLTLCKLCDFGHDQFYMKKDLCNPHKSFFFSGHQVLKSSGFVRTWSLRHLRNSPVGFLF